MIAVLSGMEIERLGADAAAPFCGLEGSAEAMPPNCAALLMSPNAAAAQTSGAAETFTIKTTASPQAIRSGAIPNMYDIVCSNSGCLGH
jgi:hypothetical protein